VGKAKKPDKVKSSKIWPSADEAGAVWDGGIHAGSYGFKGSVVAISPRGLICLSIDLAEKLNPKMPYAMLTYYQPYQTLRIRIQQEIIAGALRWVPAKARPGRINGRSALKLWGILPKRDVEIHEAVLHSDDGTPYIDVDLAAIVSTRKSPSQVRKDNQWKADRDPDNY